MSELKMDLKQDLWSPAFSYVVNDSNCFDDG